MRSDLEKLAKIYKLSYLLISMHNVDFVELEFLLV